MAAELVREQVLLNLRDEVPHSVAVFVDRFKERDTPASAPGTGVLAGMTYISAVIYVERDTQKMILLGKDGAMIKRIGQAARQSIEELLETRVYLDLWVKVRPKWRTDEEELRRLGYALPKPKKAKGGGRARHGKPRTDGEVCRAAHRVDKCIPSRSRTALRNTISISVFLIHDHYSERLTMDFNRILQRHDSCRPARQELLRGSRA